MTTPNTSRKELRGRVKVVSRDNTRSSSNLSITLSSIINVSTTTTTIYSKLHIYVWGQSLALDLPTLVNGFSLIKHLPERIANKKIKQYFVSRYHCCANTVYSITQRLLPKLNSV